MRKLFLLITLITAFAAAGSAQITVPVKKGATLPATCSPTDIQTLLFFKTGSSNGIYYCSATNTWTRTGADTSSLVGGPGSSTDNAIARFDGTTGKTVQNSAVTIADTTGAIAGARSIALSGSSSGSVTLAVPAAAGSNTITFPAGTTDFSTTGGTSRVVKQTTTGGALTVAQLAASDLSNGTTGSGAAVLATSPTLVTPNLGTPSTLVCTSCTGTASSLTAGMATTATNLAGGSGGTIPYQSAAGTTAMLANGTVGQVLQSNGTTTAPSWATLAGGGNAQTANPLSQFATTTSSALAGVISDETGSGALVFATSPALTTPTIGAATATSVNKVAITAPASSATLTIADGKTATVNNSITMAGTDSTTMTFPSTSATIARTDAANTFTGHQTVEGVTTTGATGTGNLVFGSTPTIATPVINGLPTGTGIASAATASTLTARDANANETANNFLHGFATTATAAGTTTLTVASKAIQEFTGSTTQTVTLPVTSTLVTGQKFTIINRSSGAVTVNSSGGNLVQTVAANSSADVVCVSTSGTGAASWDPVYTTPGGSGTVTSVSVTTANGVSGSVATSTTTPAISLTLGAITPTTVNGVTITTGTGTLVVPKVWRGMLTQSGTSAPVATVMENSLGGTVTFARTGMGDYTATLSSAFTTNKTFVLIAGVEGFSNYSFPSSSIIEFLTFEPTDTFSDGKLANTSFQILVYP